MNCVKDFMDVLLSPEVLFIYGLIFVMIVVIVCILVFDKKGKKKFFVEEEEDDEEEEVELVEAPRERPKVVKPLKQESEEPVMTSPIKEEPEVKYIDPVLDQTSAQIELQKLTEALEKREEPDVNSIIHEFESEQEENAIISLEELLQKGKQMYSQNEVKQYAEEDSPISIDELQSRYEDTKKDAPVEPSRPVVNMNLDMMEKPLPENQEEDLLKAPFDFDDKKFRTSPVISPVFGLYQDRSNSKVTASIRPSEMRAKETSISPPLQASENQLELENTANYDKLDEEIRKTNEFLRQLRELQKKLD